MPKSNFEKLKLQYGESTTWTMYFLGITLSFFLGSISMETVNPSLSQDLFRWAVTTGIFSGMLFLMKEYRYYKVLRFLKGNRL